MSDEKHNYATATRDGYDVPLIGIPKESQKEICERCGRTVAMSEAQFDGQEIMCKECFEDRE